MSVINYTLSQFPNNDVNQPSFIKEINDSAISATLIGVGVNGNDVTVSFQTTLSGGDNTILTNLRNAHQGDLTNGRLDIYYDQSPDVIVPTGSWTDIPFTDNRVVDDGFTHSPGATGTTVNVDGDYIITSRTSTQSTAGTGGGARTISESRITVNGVAIPGSLGAMYNRLENLGHNSTTIQVIQSLNTGDVIGVQVQAFIGSGTIRLLSEGCGLTITPI